MSSWQTLLGIELPIIQAPMAGVQGSALAVAVSNAGGLGSLPCAMLTTDAMRRELTAVTAQTASPINLNFFCHATPVRDPERERRWQQILQPYYRELNIGDVPPLVPGRIPFNDDAAAIIEQFKPRVVSFHFGLPSAPLLARVRATGALILSTATTLSEAQWLEARGVDAVIAQGIEAGGHRGVFLSDDLATQAPTVTLVQELHRAISLPIVAAGGIANPVDVATLLDAGAAAVQVGTAYLLCPETTTSAVHRSAITTGDRSTVITNVFTGRPARGLMNRLIHDLGPMNDDVPAFPLASAAIGPLRTAAEQRGSGDFSPMWAGTRVSQCREVGAAGLTRELASLVRAD